MPNIKNAAYYQAQGAIVIDGDTHTGISNFTLTPTPATAQHVDVGGDVQSVAGPPSWKCEFEFPQDFITPGSLSRKSLEWAGLEKVISFVPAYGGVGFTVSVIFQPATIGGAARTIPTSRLSLDCNGQPVVIPVGG